MKKKAMVFNSLCFNIPKEYCPVIQAVAKEKRIVYHDAIREVVGRIIDGKYCSNLGYRLCGLDTPRKHTMTFEDYICKQLCKIATKKRVTLDCLVSEGAKEWLEENGHGG